MMRHESRGLHYSRDYPELLPQARDTVFKRQVLRQRLHRPAESLGNNWHR